MAETATPRLMAAAKEFNIGKDTLVDFLTGKGFSKDDLKPTSRKRKTKKKLFSKRRKRSR